jgi:hypothetical protein
MIRSGSRSSIIFAVTLAACNAQEETPPGQAVGEPTQAAPGSAAADPSVVHHPEPPARPETKRDSIQVEGDWQLTTARLVQPQASIPFSTYVPEGVLFEQVSSGEGEGFYFKANFAGRRNDNAFMLVFVLPEGSTKQDAEKLADALLASHAGPNITRIVRHGSYQGWPFYRALIWPGDYGDGMGANTAYIARQWVWLNDGKSLESTLEPQSE